MRGHKIKEIGMQNICRRVSAWKSLQMSNNAHLRMA